MTDKRSKDPTRPGSNASQTAHGGATLATGGESGTSASGNITPLRLVKQRPVKRSEEHAFRSLRGAIQTLREDGLQAFVVLTVDLEGNLQANWDVPTEMDRDLVLAELEYCLNDIEY